MNRRSRARLIGAIRLALGVDTIGIPVFGIDRANSVFVPEMDSDLRITRFLDFYNEHDFHVAYDLTKEQRSEFSIGDPAPLPFWFADTCHVIEGDADADQPERMFGRAARANPVLIDLAILLDDARSGRIQERINRWQSEDMSSGFSDVFDEPPVRSRYWVSRYRVAVTHARSRTRPPHPIDVKLRRAAHEWLRRFATKSDFPQFSAMLGAPEEGVFSRRQIVEATFGFFVQKITSGNSKDVEQYASEPWFGNLFPSGIYGYYVKHGWPKVPFSYIQEVDLTLLARNRIIEAKTADGVQRLPRLIFLVFGTGQLPDHIEMAAKAKFHEVQRHFNAVRKGFSGSHQEEHQEDEIIAHWGDSRGWASSILRIHNALMDLDGIINGEDRLKRVPVDGRFRVRLQELAEWRKYAQEEKRRV